MNSPPRELSASADTSAIPSAAPSVDPMCSLVQHEPYSIRCRRRCSPHHRLHTHATSGTPQLTVRLLMAAWQTASANAEACVVVPANAMSVLLPLYKRAGECVPSCASPVESPIRESASTRPSTVEVYASPNSMVLGRDFLHLQSSASWPLVCAMAEIPQVGWPDTSPAPPLDPIQKRTWFDVTRNLS